MLNGEDPLKEFICIIFGIIYININTKKIKILQY